MSRYSAYIGAWILLLVSLPLALRWPGWWWGTGIGAALVLLGTWDLLQTRTTLRRNYPILAHFRYGLESVGPEMRQYFIEGDTVEAPFSQSESSSDLEDRLRSGDLGRDGGGYRNRTGLHGFAIRCVTSPPTRRCRSFAAI